MGGCGSFIKQYIKNGAASLRRVSEKEGSMKILIALIATVALILSSHSQINKEKTIVTRPKVKVEKVSKVLKRKIAKKVTPLTPCQYADKLLAENFDATQIHTAKAVMRAESGCNAQAYNGSNSDGSNDAGLMQINSVHCPHLIRCEDRTNPVKNIKAARQIYNGSGWSAWSSYNSGAYIRFK